jgi:REP element-mobilizing transposase RayT
MMKYNPQNYHRKSYRLQSHDYSAPAAYFVTLVTKDRESLFGDVVNDEMVFNDLGKIADEYFREIPNHFPNTEIDVSQVMPNHVHGIIVIHAVEATHFVGATHIVPAGEWGALTTNLWQRNYHDHIIRNEKEWQTIREYILSNPANWAEDQDNPGIVKSTLPQSLGAA